MAGVGGELPTTARCRPRVIGRVASQTRAIYRWWCGRIKELSTTRTYRRRGTSKPPRSQLQSGMHGAGAAASNLNIGIL